MLTALAIKNAAPQPKAYKLFDGGGLHLVINPNGSKLWRLKYRHLGKEKLISFGPYPDVSLVKARKAREEARELIAEGLDPAEQRREVRERELQTRERTFQRLVGDFIQKQEREGRAESTLKKNRWLLGMACDEFGELPVVEIKAPVILKALRKVEARGTYETARRMKIIINSALPDFVRLD